MVCLLTVDCESRFHFAAELSELGGPCHGQAPKDSRVVRGQALTFGDSVGYFWPHAHVLTVCSDNGVQF